MISPQVDFPVVGYANNMPDSSPLDLCMGIPLHHQQKLLLDTTFDLTHSITSIGNHVHEVQNYGQRRQTARGDVSYNEIEFTKWLASPDTKDGVLFVLLQPAEYQAYYEDHQWSAKDCITLNAVDEVCRAITGKGLENTSCFDAFPYQKVPVRKCLEDSEDELDEAYAIFLKMVEEKQPDIIFCCYRSPHRTKFKEFESVGVGRTRNQPVIFRGHEYTCVNGFHPSYAMNYLSDRSILRKLFIAEATQAFYRANESWIEPPWIKKLRLDCSTGGSGRYVLFLIPSHHDKKCN
jgi:hypothetical protein